MSSYVYLIAFGGNVGDRVQNAHGSLSRLARHGHIGRQSRWILTEPMRSQTYSTQDHDEYLNFVFEFVTELRPDELYKKICAIEDELGHDRSARWRPRAVDLDLLFWSDNKKGTGIFELENCLSFVTRDGSLQIPHAEIWKRDFLLDLIDSDLGISRQDLKYFFVNQRGKATP